MSYTLEIEKSAKKNLVKIDNPFFNAINEKLEALKTDPRPHGCKKLVGHDGWRIRVADYRIIYTINDNILKIVVVEIDNRKQIYR